MAFSISEFAAQISAPKFGGLGLSTKHLVVIEPPQALRQVLVSNRELSFFCDTVELPGRTISTVEYKPDGYGRTLDQPTGRTKTPLATTFYIDSNRSIPTFFYSWHSLITGADTGYRDVTTGTSPFTSNISARADYELAYRHDYATQMFIIGYGDGGDKKITYSLFNAYPTVIGSIQTGWEMDGTVMKLPVSFSYETITTQQEDINLAGETPVRSSIDLFSRLSQLGTIAGVINSARRPRNLQDLINLGTTIRTTARGLHLY